METDSFKRKQSNFAIQQFVKSSRDFKEQIDSLMNNRGKNFKSQKGLNPNDNSNRMIKNTPSQSSQVMIPESGSTPSTS